MHVLLVQGAVEHLQVSSTTVNVLFVFDCELDDQRLVFVWEGLELARQTIEASILRTLKKWHISKDGCAGHHDISPVQIPLNLRKLCSWKRLQKTKMQMEYAYTNIYSSIYSNKNIHNLLGPWQGEFTECHGEVLMALVLCLQPFHDLWLLFIWLHLIVDLRYIPLCWIAELLLIYAMFWGSERVIFFFDELLVIYSDQTFWFIEHSIALGSRFM